MDLSIPENAVHRATCSVCGDLSLYMDRICRISRFAFRLGNVAKFRRRRLIKAMTKASKAQDKGMLQPHHEDISLMIAESRDQWAAAFELVQRSYERAGLAGPNRFGLRVTPYHLLPTTEVFIAELRGEVICTVTLVRDGELGLPMQSLYPDEVAERRAAGLHLAEVSSLADRRSDPRRFFPLFVALSRLMVQAARMRKVDQLLVAVHPRHARFYSRYMAFEPIGEERAYPLVQNNPAVAMCLDFARIDEDPPASYSQFFGQQLPEYAIRYRPMPETDCNYFRPMVQTVTTASSPTPLSPSQPLDSPNQPTMPVIEARI